MPKGIPPLAIDLIEILYGTGEIPIRTVHEMAGEYTTMWQTLAVMISTRTASLWIIDKASTRRLADWEVARLLRHRLHGSSEDAPPDDRLTLRDAERTTEAYHSDFARWYEQEFGRE